MSNDCLDSAAQSILKKHSFSNVLTIFEQIESEGLVSSCHDFMQFLARNQYAISKNLSELFNQCSAACFGACYHGAVEGYLNAPYHDYSKLNLLETKKILISACEPLKYDSRQGFFSQCVHGIGHGFMLVSEWDLNASLKLCDLLPTDREQNDCYGGAFMEFFPGSSKSDQSNTFLKSDDPYYPCTELEDRYLPQCYAFLIAQISLNQEKPFEYCKAINPKYGPICYSVVGIRYLGFTQEPSGLKDLCDKALAGKPRSLCITGVILSYTDRFGGDPPRLYKMSDFCAIVDDEYKTHCYNKVGLALIDWIEDPEERTRACGFIQDFKNQELCLNPDNNKYQELFETSLSG